MSDLYLEPFGGMAGDMLLAALLDLGHPRFGLEDLRRLAAELVPGACQLELTTAWRGNLSGKHLDVRTAESSNPPHRHYADLEQLVRACEILPRNAAERALRVLWRIALAEARVHGTTPQEIHFHEVGAVDTLIDVCGACFALECLEVERVFASTPLVGSGTVRCAHGEMPVPAPAVAELLRGRAMILGGGGERLTPTGAALLVELAPHFEEPGEFIAESIGYGAGTRDPRDGPPNILRVQLGRAASAREASAGTLELPARGAVWQLELQLDDMTGEELARAAAALRTAGALDVWSVGVSMKKERPGVLLCALARASAKSALEAAVFEHTTSFGLRWTEAERSECGRSTREVDLLGQRVRVKLRHRPDYSGASAFGERDLSPEHDDVVRAAVALGLSLREVERRAIALALDS